MSTVLVTGVGAVTGYGVVRSLRSSRPDLRIVGTDINADAVGAHWCDDFVQAPMSLASGYPEWLRATTREHRVQLVLPTIDADLDRHVLTPDLLEDLDCVIALNSPIAIRLSRDKWALDQALVAQGDPARIPSAMVDDFDQAGEHLGVPFLVKARHGQGGRGLAVVANAADFARVAGSIPDKAFGQRIVGTADEEYTVGIFGDGNGIASARIVMRRRLASAGMTRRAEVVEPPPSLAETLDRLARLLTPLGPTNLQFRREGRQWYLLEVNARFSSSTSLRELFGYHEAAMTVDWFLHGKPAERPHIRQGLAARYLEDVMLDDRARL